MAITGTQRLESPVGHLAVFKIGAASVPLTVLLCTDGLRYRLADREATTLLADRSAIEAIRSARDDVDSLNLVITNDAFDDVSEVNFWNAIEEHDTQFETASTAADETAFIIYSSGGPVWADLLLFQSYVFRSGEPNGHPGQNRIDPLWDPPPSGSVDYFRFECRNRRAGLQTRADMIKITHTRDRVVTVAMFAALLAVLPLFFEPSTTYISRRFVRVMIFAIFAMALNIIFGETDQLILFIGGIAAVGAYTTALTAEAVGISPWLTLFPGALTAGLLGAVVCYVAARRQFTVIVLAIVTFAFQMIISEVLVGLRDITGGSTGFPFSGLQLPVVERLTGLGSYAVQFYALLAIFAGVLGVYTWLRRSKYGLAFAAIRQDEFAARATGVNVVKLKVFAGFIATFVIGLVGPFYGQATGIIIPSLYSFNAVDVLVLILLVLGGLRSRYGPLVGAAVVIYIDDVLGNFGQWRTVAFGLLLTILFLYFRDGIVPSLQSLVDNRELPPALSAALGRGKSE